MDVLPGADFSTVEVLTWKGLVTYYVLFFIHLDRWRLAIAGLTAHPDKSWMQQMARNATLEHWGYLNPALLFARSRYEVLRFVPGHFGNSECEMPGASTPESKLECVCRTVGPIGSG